MGERPGGTPMNLRWRDGFLLVAGFTAVAVAMTMPLWAHPRRLLPADLVDTLLNSWIIAWDSDRLRHGLSGLWDAPIYFPYRNTLAFSENLLGLALFVAPVYWVTDNPVLTYNVAFLFSFVVAGVGMYLLAYQVTGSRAAAIVGAVFYAFCPFRMAQVSHIQMVATGWIPVVVYGLERYFASRGRMWLGVFTASFCAGSLSNSYVAYFMLLPVAIVIADGMRHDRAQLVARAAELAVVGLLVAAVLGPVAYRYYRVRVDYGQVRNAADIERGSADVRSYLVGKDTIGVWRWLPTAVPTDPEKELFPGVVPVVLAAIAVWHAFRRRGSTRHAVVLYGSIALAASLLSLGPHVRVWGHLVTNHGPYGWLVAVVPGMDGMRVPARLAIVVFFALSVIAALGAKVALSSLPRAIHPVAVAGGVALLLAESWPVPFTVYAYAPRALPADRAVAEWLGDRAPGAVLHLPIAPSVSEQLNAQYATLRHHHPLVNGFSGYDTPLQTLLADASGPLNDFSRFSASVRMLRSIGVRYIIVHPDDHAPPQLERNEYRQTIERLRESGQVVLEQRLPDADAFALEPWREAPVATAPAGSMDADLVEIQPGEMKLSAAQGGDRLALVADRDPDTRWFGEQNGAIWIAAAFPRAYDVARVEMQLAERSLMDYPRELRIDAIDGSGRIATVYAGAPYPELLAGILRDPRYPPLVIALPHNTTATLRISDVAEVPGRWWSIHELRIWRRSSAPAD